MRHLLFPLLGLALWSGALVAETEPPATQPARPESPTPRIEDADVERLFLQFIYDRKSLIRSCLFLGGVQIEEVSYRGSLAVARIRYRIQCEQEEITAPPLTRTLREDFVYRYSGGLWEILGRATELPPGLLRGETPPGEEGRGAESAPAPVVDPDRQSIVEELLAWAVLGNPPLGSRDKFPGGKFFGDTFTILVSEENLGGMPTPRLPGREVVVLPPEALIQRTVLLGGGKWVRFESLEIEDRIGHAVMSVVIPVLPLPPPGAERTRVLSRVDVSLVRRKAGWILTRFLPT